MNLFHNFPSQKVAACLPVLGVVNRQITRVRERIESAVIETCQRFSAMATNTNQMVHLTVGSGDQEARGADLIDNARTQILELVDNLNAGNSIIADISSEVLSLQAQLDAVHSALTQVEIISNRARIVALNGKMEAVKAGENGVAFSEVANQTRGLATNVENLSQDIRNSIQAFSAHLQSVAERTSAYAEQSTAKVSAQTDAAHNLLNELERNQIRLESNLVEATKLGQELSTDISRAVTLLQFQDEVNQQMDHVMTAADKIQELIRESVSERDAADDNPVAVKILSELESMYTMNQERFAHDAVEQAAESNKCDIELF
ncbi:MAG: hypothetical protein R3C03_00350 [Pirellulaceae bacterium]